MRVWRVIDEVGDVIASMPLCETLDPVAVASGRKGYGIYEAIGASGDVIYTGRTGDLSARLRSHSHQSAWWGFAREIRWTPCSDYAELVAVERLAISTDHGIWNRLGHQQLGGTGKHELPATTSARLVSLYAATGQTRSEADIDLDNFIATLRHFGWTLQSIAAPLSITRERVRQRSVTGVVDYDLVVPRPPTRPAGHVKKFWPTISDVTAAEIRELMPLAARVRGKTPLNHPNRVASERLSEIFAEARLRGVRTREIAAVAGCTEDAVIKRLGRHGYMTNPPSQSNYQPGSAMVQPERCGRGHEFAGDNVRHINGDRKRRVCRSCEQIRVQRYRDKTRKSA